MNDMIKARRKVKQLINKAETYRDRHGYRENLGYDSDVKLRDYLSTLNLTYFERCEILDEFFQLCRQI